MMSVAELNIQQLYRVVFVCFRIISEYERHVSLTWDLSVKYI